MNPNPWNPRALVGLAALAILLGVGAAYCDHRGDGDAPADPCTGVAYALPAGPIQGTKTSSSSRKNGDTPPRVSKEPRPAATAAAKPSPSATSHRPRNHIDLDLDLDGC